MALLGSLSSSLSGMKVAQSQLEIVSNNIANVDSKGYTRKTAAQSAYVVAGETMGVLLGNVQRTVDEGLLKSFLSSNSLTSSMSTRYDYLSRLDNYMGTTADNNSLAANVGNLQSAFETFSTNVSSPASRYSLLTNAQNTVNKLNYLSSSIQTLRGDADMQINDAISTVNSLLKSLDSLNDDIVKYNVLDRDGVANLEDQRDQVLRELSSYIDITYYTRDTKEIVLQTASGVLLLDNNVHELSHAALAQIGPDNSYDNGNVLGIFVDGVDVTTKLNSGKIGGLIDIRDNTLTALQSQLDELSYALYSEINAVHNQGTAFPNMPSEVVGTATFIKDKTTGEYIQNIRLEQGDVRFVIFDENGKQVTTTTLAGDIGFKQGTLSDMMTKLQDWLQSPQGASLSYASVYMDGTGHLVIDTGDSAYGISIIDEASSTPGAAQQDAVIGFDVNGDGVYDTQASGFSSFFGLNDFFVTNQREYIYDSKVLSDRASVGTNTPTVWSFSDTANGFDYGSVTITRAMTIKDIAEQINTNPDLNTHVKASLVANGDGYMLRVESLEGVQLEIAETSGGGVLERLDMRPSSCGCASTIAVRDNIRENAALIVSGTPSFDSTKGAYTINSAANNIANKLAGVFTASHVFGQAGDMAKTTTTIANYTSTFVGNVASLTNTTEEAYTYQSALSQALSYKEAQVSGVNMDEELSQMIIFQKSYAACAQVFTASRELLDILLGLV